MLSGVESNPKKRMGRPPSGLGKDGEPERIADYPRLGITIRPHTRARLNAAATVESRPAWQIVDDSINQYVERMPPADRRMVESIAKRTESNRES